MTPDTDSDPLAAPPQDFAGLVSALPLAILKAADDMNAKIAGLECDPVTEVILKAAVNRAIHNLVLGPFGTTITTVGDVTVSISRRPAGQTPSLP